jgi:hypothetical protein
MHNCAQFMHKLSHEKLKYAELVKNGSYYEVTIYYDEDCIKMREMQPSDIEDILPPEKIAFIAYNVGIFESVQKFGNLITSGKVTGEMDPVKVAEFLEETRAFYDAEMIAQVINGMLAQRASLNLPPLTVERVTASQVDYVIRQLKAAGISLNK